MSGESEAIAKSCCREQRRWGRCQIRWENLAVLAVDGSVRSPSLKTRKEFLNQECCRAAGISASKATATPLPRSPSTELGARWAAPCGRGITREKRTATRRALHGASWSFGGHVLSSLPVAFSCPFIASFHRLQKVGKGQEVTKKHVCFAWQGELC